MATATLRSRGAGERTLIAPAEQPAPSSRPDPRAHSCPECGHVLRVSGVGRHRVYFERDEDRSVDPVMDGACPGCGRGLPGKNPARSRS